MLKKIKFSSILFTVLSLSLAMVSCNSDKKKDEERNINKSIKFVKIKPEKGLSFPGFDKYGYRYGETNLELKSGKKLSINWEIYQSGFKKSTISVPSEWVINSNKKAFLYFNLDSMSNDFFIWMKHSKTIPDLTLESFTDYVYSTVLADTTEICRNPKLQKRTFETRVAYSFECDIVKNDTFYKTYSYFTEDKDHVYEFSIRFLSANDDGLNKVLFDLIMDNIYIDDRNIFGDSLPKIESIDIGIR